MQLMLLHTHTHTHTYICIYIGGGVYRVLVWKPEGRRPLGRPRRRWADNIRMDLQEVGCVYMDWIGLAQDREKGGGRL